VRVLGATNERELVELAWALANEQRAVSRNGVGDRPMTALACHGVSDRQTTYPHQKEELSWHRTQSVLATRA
jgi:hypothetical protein